MLSFFSNFLIKTGEFIVQTGNVGCTWFWFCDEPECPNSLIE